jgi:CxxC motif-containing protein (DUF1111 family)
MYTVKGRLLVLVSMGGIGLACGEGAGPVQAAATDRAVAAAAAPTATTDPSTTAAPAGADPAAAPGLPGNVPGVVGTGFGDPVPGLSGDERTRFDTGLEEFAATETPDEGLGPIFNDTSCGACHSVPVTGGGSARLETRFGARIAGKFDPLTAQGGSLIQEKGIGIAGECNYVGELVPSQATLQSKRRSTPLFGLGLVDAVPDGALQALAALERAFPGETGRVAMVHDIARNRNAPGRFGWKNQVPTLHQFAGDAYLNEMGVTSPEFPDELCPQGDCALLRCNPLPTLNDDGTGPKAFQDFMTMLGPPPRGTITAAVRHGEQVFRQTSCNHCHTETLITGSSPVPALRAKVFHPYSDFLLHDMGILGDGIELGGARGNEFRTSPLWGLRQLTSFLHDGRAGSIEQAIRAHAGQGDRAAQAFARLSPGDRADLLAFLNSL